MKEHICSPDGEQRERRAEGEEKTQRRIKDLDGSLSLNPSIHFSLCLTHMAGFLHVHTSSVTTKVTTREGLARPQARRRREWRGGGVMAVVAWLALSPRHLPFERPFFFSILHFLSLSLPSVKPSLGAFSATEGRRLEGGSVALSSSHHPLHPSTPTLCLLPDKMCAPNKRCDSRGGRFVSTLTLITLTIPKSRPYFMSVPLHARANALPLSYSL